ncbi:putative pilus system C39 family peptidase FilB [Acinetobacter schindleri]|uniref:putative pilus system C39 family peptidase FilB n=1 Tax=Acinetobacter schindleri TaxID=108981 RepID=UPI0013B0A2C0|nr:C39 family peptidase [Acinetobacter schindleri]MCO8068694.1 C39 family peptidase [Acinetobacter schindleri]QIC61725.1 C39 family peptidase [Acinetobacter schindleri]
MLEIALGSALIYYAAKEAFDIKEQSAETVRYTETLDSRQDSFVRMHRESVKIKPALQDQFRGIVRQAYDYSCGSAALTTLLNGYVGTQLNEQQIMNGLLEYGERDKIIERRSFSLLDMKRFVNALGLDSGGYRGEFEDLVKQGQPAIVPISYAGFKHFVIYKGYKDGRVYIADPALGNISFDQERFKQIWENNTLFLINIAPEQRQNFLALKEADLRHVDDATINRYALVDFQYPQFYMEKIADKASTIRLDTNMNPESESFGQPTYNFLRLYYKSK